MCQIKPEKANYKLGCNHLLWFQLGTCDVTYITLNISAYIGK